MMKKKTANLYYYMFLYFMKYYHRLLSIEYKCNVFNHNQWPPFWCIFFSFFFADDDIYRFESRALSISKERVEKCWATENSSDQLSCCGLSSRRSRLQNSSSSMSSGSMVMTHSAGGGELGGVGGTLDGDDDTLEGVGDGGALRRGAGTGIWSSTGSSSSIAYSSLSRCTSTCTTSLGAGTGAGASGDASVTRMLTSAPVTADGDVCVPRRIFVEARRLMMLPRFGLEASSAAAGCSVALKLPLRLATGGDALSSCASTASWCLRKNGKL